MSASSTDITGGALFPAHGDDFGDELNEDLRARVKTELEPGERLLWAGQSAPPPPRFSIARSAWFTVAALFLGCGLIGVLRALSLPRPRFSESDSTMPLGIGLTLLGGIILVITAATWVRKRFQMARESTICYAVTDRRAISWVPEEGSDAVRVHSWQKGRIRDVVRVERPDGSGNLEFTLAEDSRHYWLPAGFNHIRHIREVRRVEQIVRHNLMIREDVS